MLTCNGQQWQQNTFKLVTLAVISSCSFSALLCKWVLKWLNLLVSHAHIYIEDTLQNSQSKYLQHTPDKETVWNQIKRKDEPCTDNKCSFCSNMSCHTL